MHIMFLIFATLHGQPTGLTQRIQPEDSTCRHEFNMIKGVNQANDQHHTGVVYYGSCEPVNG